MLNALPTYEELQAKNAKLRATIARLQEKVSLRMHHERGSNDEDTLVKRRKVDDIKAICESCHSYSHQSTEKVCPKAQSTDRATTTDGFCPHPHPHPHHLHQWVSKPTVSDSDNDAREAGGIVEATYNPPCIRCKKKGLQCTRPKPMYVPQSTRQYHFIYPSDSVPTRS